MQQCMGKSRTTIARRATAFRVFTAWLARTGRSATDAGKLLASPKAHKTLPDVLRADEAKDLVEQAAALADDDSPVGIRDVAILELMYAKIGRAHVCTPVTHAHLVCRLLLAKKKET